MRQSDKWYQMKNNSISNFTNPACPPIVSLLHPLNNNNRNPFHSLLVPFQTNRANSTSFLSLFFFFTITTPFSPSPCFFTSNPNPIQNNINNNKGTTTTAYNFKQQQLTTNTTTICNTLQTRKHTQNPF